MKKMKFLAAILAVALVAGSSFKSHKAFSNTYAVVSRTDLGSGNFRFEVKAVADTHICDGSEPYCIIETNDSPSPGNTYIDNPTILSSLPGQYSE